MTAARRAATEVASKYAAGDPVRDPSGDVAVLARDYLMMTGELRRLHNDLDIMRRMIAEQPGTGAK
jgi:hypothetical protein